MEDCGGDADLGCRDKTLALHLKGGGIALILTASAIGVVIPLIGRRLQCLKSDGNIFSILKAFAAGVILATGFVHMLPSAMVALTNPCLPSYPWQKFPFTGFIAMLASLGTLVIDFVATEFYETQHDHGGQMEKAGASTSMPAHAQMLYKSFTACGRGIYSGSRAPCRISRPDKDRYKDVVADHNLVPSMDKDKELEEDGRVHIIGMRAHTASHSHSHPDGHHTSKDVTHDHVLGTVGHTHDINTSDEGLAHIRHVVIAQVLELGIVAHSVIIGIALGVSERPCTIRPLLGALSFHQFFEGFALGGCISQAGFNYLSAALMACFFAITTPTGIAIGIGISSSYNENSPRSLVVEGVFDSISAGILVYMSLVDLIAADFLSKKMRCNRRLQVYSYFSLLSGCFAMSALAIWT